MADSIAEQNEADALTAFAAAYDAEKGELVFDADRDGEFIVLQFFAKEEAFTEGFYRELAQREDVKQFLSVHGN